jgi:hypothetical protein
LRSCNRSLMAVSAAVSAATTLMSLRPLATVRAS